ncbi:hypothetical protein TURU_086021 [Turdus rufiventris]|nr:hypothetical protein TURU_086021 [Turdus rufiventris]
MAMASSFSPTTPSPPLPSTTPPCQPSSPSLPQATSLDQHCLLSLCCLGPLLPATELARTPFCNMHLLGLVLVTSLHAAKSGSGVVMAHLPFSIKSIIVRKPGPSTGRSCASQSNTLGSACIGLSLTTALPATPDFMAQISSC